MMRGILLTCIAACLLSCGEDILKNTRLASGDIAEQNTRIEILKKYVRPASDVRDAEFNLFNVNGFGESRMDLPGASSWNYKFVVRIDTADEKLWTGGLNVIVPDTIIDWVNDVGIVEERKRNWKCVSKPRYYTGKGVLVISYAAEGVVYKVLYNN